MAIAMNELSRQVMDLSPTSLVFVLMTLASRPLGAFFGLWGLYFVLGPATALRIAVATIISLPFMVPHVEIVINIIDSQTRYMLFLFPVREFVLGFSLGLLFSLPFFSILGAAILVDQYLGDFAPGLQAPEELTVGAYANMCVVISLFLFAEMGGFFELISSIAMTYSSIPINAPLGDLPDAFGVVLGSILQSVMYMLLILAAPIIIVLLFIEFSLSLAFRVAGQIRFPQVDFLLKNLIFVVLLPPLSIVLVRGIGHALDDGANALQLLNSLTGK